LGIFSNFKPVAYLSFAEILWYVFSELPRVVLVIKGMMSLGRKLLVVQNSPFLDSSFVGKDVVPSRSVFLGYFPADATPLV
jgi:hypothetical protein